MGFNLELLNGIPQASKASIKALDLRGVNCTDFDLDGFQPGAIRR